MANDDDPDIPPEGREALERLLDTYAVESEHRDVTRLQLLRETFERLLRHPDFQDERHQNWLCEALRSIDEQEQS